MDLTFRSYPGGKLHAIRTMRVVGTSGPLGSGTEYHSPCGTRSVMWDRVFYQDRVTSEPANCKSCNMKKIKSETGTGNG